MAPFDSMKPGIDYIGVTCCFVCHDGQGKILLGKRGVNCRDEHGRWDCGGGQVEHGEEFEEAVRREVMEEYGAEPIEMQFIQTRSVLREHDGVPTHWVVFLYAVLVDPAQIRNGEPHKIDEIGWFDPDELPDPLHSAFAEEVELVKQWLSS